MPPNRTTLVRFVWTGEDQDEVYEYNYQNETVWWESEYDMEHAVFSIHRAALMIREGIWKINMRQKMREWIGKSGSSTTPS